MLPAGTKMRLCGAQLQGEQADALTASQSTRLTICFNSTHRSVMVPHAHTWKLYLLCCSRA